MDMASDQTRPMGHTIRDLAAISALPAMWVSFTPRRIAESLAEALLSTLTLDFVYLRLRGRTPEFEIEIARSMDGESGDGCAQELGRLLAPWLDRGSSHFVQSVPNPLGVGTVQIAFAPFVFDADDAMLIAGSRHSNFPGEDDRLLLSVAANQGAWAFERLRAEEALRRSEEQLASDLASMTRLQDVSTRLVQSGDENLLLLEIVDAAISVTAADMGSIQLLDGGSGTLKIVATRGFERPFLDYFDQVHGGETAYGAAMQLLAWT